MWYPVAGTTVPYLRNCGTRLLEQWCNSGRNLHGVMYINKNALDQDVKRREDVRVVEIPTLLSCFLYKRKRRRGFPQRR